jgi:hypothetical protein
MPGASLDHVSDIVTPVQIVDSGDAMSSDSRACADGSIEVRYSEEGYGDGAERVAVE